MNTSQVDREHLEANALPDEAIDFSDIPETTAEDWARARVIRVRKAERMAIRIDEDVLDYFREQGSNFQARINAVLRDYMEAHS